MASSFLGEIIDTFVKGYCLIQLCLWRQVFAVGDVRVRVWKCVLTHEHLTHADMYMCLVLCESLPALEIVPDTKILRQTPPESTPIPFSQEIHEEFG